jgi:hypothetical protein
VGQEVHKATQDKDAHQCDFLDEAVSGSNALPLLRTLSLVKWGFYSDGSTACVPSTGFSAAFHDVKTMHYTLLSRFCALGHEPNGFFDPGLIPSCPYFYLLQPGPCGSLVLVVFGKLVRC